MARAQVEAFYTALSAHIVTVTHAPGTTEAYLSALEQLKTALYDHTDITREIEPLENAEKNPNEQMALSKAVARSKQTDKMVIELIVRSGDEYGHPGGLVNHQTYTVLVTNQIVASTDFQKRILHEYKERNHRLWERGALGRTMGGGLWQP